jgi:hypothetical protein
VVDKINKTDPDLKVQPAHVKNHLTVFVNALVENPSFDSQTKETLTTRPRNFGSDCQLSTQLLDNILERTRIVDTVRRRDLPFLCNASWQSLGPWLVVCSRVASLLGGQLGEPLDVHEAEF